MSRSAIPSPSYSREYTNLSYDQSWLGNGTSQNAAVASAVSVLNLTSNSGSWGGWVNLTAYPGSPFISTIVSNEVSGGGYTLRLGNGGGHPGSQANLRLRIGGSDQNVYSPIAGVPLSKWALIIGTYDGTNMYIYINGVLVGQNAQTGNIQSSSNACAISLSAGGRMWKGSLSNIFILTTALSVADVGRIWNIGPNNSLMNSQVFNNYTVAGYWPLNGSYSDISANNNPLVPSGSPTFNSAITASNLSRTRSQIGQVRIKAS